MNTKELQVRRIKQIVGSDTIYIEEYVMPCGTVFGRKVLNAEPPSISRRMAMKKEKPKSAENIALNERQAPAIDLNKPVLIFDGALPAREIVRAGDIILFMVVCPNCEVQTPIGYPDLGVCPCGFPFRDYHIDVSEIKQKRNIVALTEKKERQRQIRKKTVRLLMEIQQGTCAYCDNHLKKYDVDHVFPVVAGGSNNISNLVLACSLCNSIAGAKCFSNVLAKKMYILDRRKKRRQYIMRDPL